MILKIKLTKRELKIIQDTMNTKITLEDGATIYVVHHGSEESFIKRLLSEGLNKIQKDLEYQRKLYEELDKLEKDK